MMSHNENNPAQRSAEWYDACTRRATTIYLEKSEKLNRKFGPENGMKAAKLAAFIQMLPKTEQESMLGTIRNVRYPGKNYTVDFVKSLALGNAKIVDHFIDNFCRALNVSREWMDEPIIVDSPNISAVDAASIEGAPNVMGGMGRER